MKIPQYFAQELPKVPDVSAQAAAMPWEARAQLGGALADLGQKFLETELALSRERKELQFKNNRDLFLSEYDNYMVQKDVEFSKLPDKSEYASLMTVESAKKINELLGRFKDRNERERARIVFEQRHLKNVSAAIVTGNKYFLDKAIGEFEKIYFNKMLEMEKATSDEERMAVKNELFSMIDDRIKYFGEEWGQKAKNNAEKAENKIREKHNLSNAILEINRGKLDEKGVKKPLDDNDVENLIRKYNIAPDHRPSLYSHARTIRKEIEAEAEKQMTLLLVMDVSQKYEFLKDDTELYNDIRIRHLNDPNYLKEMGATLEQGERAKNFIKNHSIWLDKQRTKMYEATQDTFLSKLVQGTLTESEVLASTLPPTGLSQGDKAWFLRMIEERKRKSDAFLNSNPSTYANVIVGIIRNPSNWNREKILSYIGKSTPEGLPAGLSINDALRAYNLWDELTKAAKPSPETTLSRRFLGLQQAALRLEEYRKDFMFVVPKEGSPDKEEVIRNDMLHYQALIELQTRVEKGEDPFAVLDDIMKDYVTHKKRSWFDKVIEGITPPVFKGERIEEKKEKYIKGKVYKNAAGESAVYLGEGRCRIMDGPRKGKVVPFGE